MRKGAPDILLILLTIALVVIGIAMVYSASFVMAEKRFGSSTFFLRKQLVWVILGMGLMGLLSMIDYNRLNNPRIVYVFLGLCAILLVLVFVPGFAAPAHEANRWIRLGRFSFQPSELAKFGVVFFMAFSLVKKSDLLKRFDIGFLPHVLIPGAFMVLIILEPDFGNAAIIGMVVFVMMFIAGTRYLYLAISGTLALAAAALLVAKSSYRLERIMVFLNPWDDPQDSCYQIVQSLVAFGSGGLFGRGLAEGRQKLFYLPEMHTDFIFSNVGEELGFVGVVLVMGMFAAFLYQSLSIATRAATPFGTMLGAGIATLLGLEIVINIGVVMSVFPTKGLALPFISYGGSAEMINLAMVGILLAISRDEHEPDLRHMVNRKRHR